MKRLLWLNLLVVGVLLAGCNTPPPPPPRPVPPARLEVSEARRQIRFHVKGSVDGGVDGYATSAASYAVQELLNGHGLPVAVTEQDAEVVVVCGCACTDKTTRGSRTVLRGLLTVTMVRRAVDPGFGRKIPHEILASRKFEGKGNEGFTEAEAAGSLAASFEPALKKWLPQAVKAVTADLEIVDVRISVPQGESGPERGRAPKGDFVTRLVKGTADIPGVYSCRVRPEAQTERDVTVTVFYDRRQIPDGVVNRLRAKRLLECR